MTSLVLTKMLGKAAAGNGGKNGQVMKIGGQVFRVGKQMRANRMKAGKRVFAPGLSGYGRGWMKSRDSKLGMHTTVHQVVQAKSTNFTKNKNGPEVTPVTRSEQSLHVLSAGPGALNPAPEMFGLYPGNTNIFIALPAISSQSTFFEWKELKIIYTPSCGTNTPGMIGMAVVPTVEQANGVPDYNALVGTNKNTYGDIYTKSTLLVHPQDLDKSFNLQGCKVATMADTPHASTHVPGYLLIATSGVSAALNTVMGTITVTYRCNLIKPVVDAETIEAPLSIRSADFVASTDWFAPLVTRFNTLKAAYSGHMPIDLVRASATTGTVTFLTRKPCAILFHIGAATATNPYMNYAPVCVGCTFTTTTAISGAINGGGTQVFFVKPAYRLATITFTTTNNATVLGMSYYPVRSAHMPILG